MKLKKRWKQYDPFPMYLISDYGDVKNIKTGRILSNYKNKSGYSFTCLCDNGLKKQFFVHRLVGFLFVSGYKEGLEINHIDMNKNNNFYKNLEWVSRAKNMAKAHAHKNFKPPVFYGSKNNKAKVNENDVREIRQLEKMGVPTIVLSEYYGISKVMVCNIVARRFWKHVK